MLAAIPSPGSGSIGIGPLEFRAYGVMIALGVLAAVWLAQRRWTAKGGHPDDVSSVAVWAVPAGLVGARLYHVLTDWRFDEGWAAPFKIWEGGLGIPGGVLAGVLAALVVMRRRGLPAASMIDAMAPGVPLAQAIGRWGNWFNQELFGGPTDLPWAVEIDPRHRPAEYLTDETFHPTFLYESLWNLALCALLIVVGRAAKLRTGALLAVYVVGYLVARLWLETVRVDPATELGGVRINIWMSLTGIALAGGWLLLRGRRPDEHRAETVSSDADHGVESV